MDNIHLKMNVFNQSYELFWIYSERGVPVWKMRKWTISEDSLKVLTIAMEIPIVWIYLGIKLTKI